MIFQIISYYRSYCLSFETSTSPLENSTIQKTLIPKKEDMNATTMSPPSLQQQQQSLNERPVLYVLKQHAKTLKIILQTKQYLDTSYRMIPLANNSEHIAVPVTTTCIQDYNNTSTEKEDAWKSLVTKTGIENVPFSTKVMGKKCQQQRRKQTNAFHR